MSTQRVTELTAELAAIQKEIYDLGKRKKQIENELWAMLPDNFTGMPAHMKTTTLWGNGCFATVHWQIASALDVKRVRAEASIEQLRSWTIERPSKHFTPEIANANIA